MLRGDPEGMYTGIVMNAAVVNGTQSYKVLISGPGRAPSNQVCYLAVRWIHIKAICRRAEASS